MEQYNVTGMSCAACSARVEKAVGKVPGVENCSVSLLTNSMGVEGTATVDAVIAAVEEAGYGATLKSAKNERHGMNQSEQNCAEDALKGDAGASGSRNYECPWNRWTWWCAGLSEEKRNKGDFAAGAAIVKTAGRTDQGDSRDSYLW